MLEGAAPITDRRSSFPRTWSNAIPTNRVTETGGAATSTRLTSELRAETGYGGESPGGEHGPSVLERYEGVVGVSRADPGRAFADGEAEFEIRFPEATVRSFTRVRVDSDRDTYRIAIELVVDEDGRERHRRRWERTVPRDLQ